MGRDGSLELIDSKPGIIEIMCRGYLREELASYLPKLEAMVLKRPSVCLLFNTLSTEGFAVAFPMAHVQPFKRWLGRVPKIAVVHTMVSVGFAVTTVRLASGSNLRGFPVREAGLEWLEASETVR